jgi:malonyl-CoA O-methyltransferase
MTTEFQYATDPRAVRRRRDRIAARYDGAAALPDELVRRMLERLDVVRLPDGPILDLGCATGAGVRALRERYPDVDVLGADPSVAMLSIARQRDPGRLRWLPRLSGRASRWVCADPESLPFRAGTFAMIWSNLLPIAFRDPPRAWRALGGLLRPGGLAHVHDAGAGHARRIAQRACGRRGSPPSVMPFPDMHDVGDSLVAAGFADPVMDAEHVTLTYPDFGAVLRDLRDLGATDVSSSRRRGLLGAKGWRDVEAAYEHHRSDGRLPVTVEVVHGHAWWPAHGPRKTADGLDVIRVARPVRRV